MNPSEFSEEPRLPSEEHDVARRMSLEEVLHVGTESLLDSLDEADRGAMNFEVLENVVSRTETTLAGRSFDEPTEDNGDPVAREREGGDGIGAPELEQLVSILEREGDMPVLAENAKQRLESASILVHEVHRIGTADPEAFGRRIEERLRTVQPERMTEFLWTSCQDMAGVLSSEDFDMWMRAMVPMLRRAVPFFPDRLAGFAAVATPNIREQVWPHVVDEFLLALITRSREIDPRALDLDPESQAEAVERLLKLSAFGGARLKPGTYRIDAEFARPIAIKLMESAAHEKFGPLLLWAFRESMPFDFGVRSCVLAHRRYGDELGWVLTQQLKTPRAALIGDAQRSTAWVLTNGINELEQERRSETWIADAIRWLGERDMAHDANEQRYALLDLLERITDERRGLRRCWNSGCRKAASRALENRSLG